jgi:predicted Zn-dependent peptidase
MATPEVVIEHVPGAVTAAVGAWVRCGSAHEVTEQAGITHLIEHLLLRRCGDRTSEEIAELVDSLGGSIDAFTTREVCAVTAHVPAERFDESIELILDAVFRPRFLADEVALEQQVIAAEFDMIQDSPGEMVAEQALAACWGDHPLARPVLGRREIVESLSSSDLARFHRQRFTADRLLLVVVGPVDEGSVMDRLGRLPVAGSDPEALRPPRWRSGILMAEREGLEQLYANLVLPGLASDDPEVMTLGVLHQLLGGGASSRLFRELRDNLGLVYDVGSSVYTTAASGVLEVTFSAPVRQATACWDAIVRVLEAVAGGDISDREVEVARAAMRAGVVLGCEGTDALMEAHAGELLGRNRRFDARALLAELAAVTPERVRALASRVVRLDAVAGAVCGPRAGVCLPTWLTTRVA